MSSSSNWIEKHPDYEGVRKCFVKYDSSALFAPFENAASLTKAEASADVDKTSEVAAHSPKPAMLAA